ncbi:MAG: hypothetical protein EA398_09295 [Deltaproteobacteria bacterium]|nr:MAG: hypothetical protein EA398_09295 [Deltaproteobacteria bacterium]
MIRHPLSKHRRALTRPCTTVTFPPMNAAGQSTEVGNVTRHFREQPPPHPLVRPVSSGGMGVVYLARHATTGRPIAIKGLRDMNPETLASLAQEVRLLARLDHPGIVRIIDHRLDGPAPWYAMDYIEGQVLDEWLAPLRTARPTRTAALPHTEVLPPPGEWPPPQTDDTHPLQRDRRGAHRGTLGRPGPLAPSAFTRFATLVTRLCDALAHVHERGLVHRDVKPANILVQRDDRPVLVDFGVGHAASGTLRHEVLHRGRIRGSVHYLAPEVFDPHPVDLRADLYALGCVLFEALSGARPFAGETAAEVVRAHRHPVRPSFARYGVVAPPDIATTVERLLSLHPDDRPSDAAEVAHAFQSFASEALPNVRTSPHLLPVRLVGRVPLRTRLARRVDALHRGQPFTVLLCGPAGSGKTRIVGEMFAALQDIEARTIALGGAGAPRVGPVGPWAALGGLLRELAHLLSSLPEALRTTLLASRADALFTVCPELHAVTGGAPRETQVRVSPPGSPEFVRRVADQLGALLRGLSVRHAIGIVLDGLEEVDPSSRRVLDVLVRRLREFPAPIGILATTRQPPRDIRREAEETGWTVERMTPLTASQSRQLLQRLVRIPEPLPDAVASLVDATAEGNPWHVGVLAETLLQQGLVNAEPGRPRQWTLEPGAALPQGVPVSTDGLLHARLESLGQTTREVHATLCVAGAGLSPSLIALATRQPERSVELIIDELLSAGLVHLGSDGNFGVASGSLATFVRSMLPADRAVRLHGRIADALTAGTSEPDLPFARVAHHLERAGRNEEASDMWARAANQFREAGAIAQCLEACRAAAECTLDRSRMAARLLDAIEHGAIALNNVALALDLVNRVTPLLADDGLPSELARLRLLQDRLDLPGATGMSRIAFLRRHDAFVQRHGSPTVRRRWQARMARALALSPEPDAAPAILASVERESRQAGDIEALMETLSARAITWRRLPPNDIHRDGVAEPASIAEQQHAAGYTLRAINTLHNAIPVVIGVGRVDAAVDALRRADALQRAFGASSDERADRFVRGVVAHALGRYQDAELILRRCAEFMRATGNLRQAGYTEGALAMLARSARRPLRACRHVQNARECFPGSDLPFLEGHLLPVLYAVAVEHGWSRRERQWREPAVEAARHVNNPFGTWTCHIMHARHLRRCGELARALDVLNALVEEPLTEEFRVQFLAERVRIADASDGTPQPLADELREAAIRLGPPSHYHLTHRVLGEALAVLDR